MDQPNIGHLLEKEVSDSPPPSPPSENETANPMDSRAFKEIAELTLEMITQSLDEDPNLILAMCDKAYNEVPSLYPPPPKINTAAKARNIMATIQAWRSAADLPPLESEIERSRNKRKINKSPEERRKKKKRTRRSKKKKSSRRHVSSGSSSSDSLSSQESEVEEEPVIYRGKGQRVSDIVFEEPWFTHKILHFFTKTHLDIPTQIKTLFDHSGRTGKEKHPREVEAITLAWAIHSFLSSTPNVNEALRSGKNNWCIYILRRLYVLYKIEKDYQDGISRKESWKANKFINEEFIQELPEMDRDIQRAVMKHNKHKLAVSSMSAKMNQLEEDKKARAAKKQ